MTTTKSWKLTNYTGFSTKKSTQTRENVYIITIIRRDPRQIVGFDVGLDKTAGQIQKIADSGPEAEEYCTDGYVGYLNVAFPGQHLRNMHDKKDTHIWRESTLIYGILYRYCSEEAGASHVVLKH